MADQSGESYYSKGSQEPIKESAVTIKKLEKRRKLTTNSNRLVIVLVGLPGRGKSVIGRKLHTFFTWRGHSCKVFNVGKYRRAQVKSSDGGGNDGACDADFFDSNNEAAAQLRNEAAKLALKELLKWLDIEDAAPRTNSGSITRVPSETFLNFYKPSKDRVAIFDATNSTIARRKMIVEEVTNPAKRAGKPTGIVFVESICDDKELLEENFNYKISVSPDFQGMDKSEAMADLKKRVKKYEEQYETIEEDSYSYIKLYNLSSKIMANQIYGRMSKVVIPALMAWNIGTRPIWICRAGQTLDDDEEEKKRALKSAEGLGRAGSNFRDALRQYITSEGLSYMADRLKVFSLSLNTGTSISGSVRASERKPDEGGIPFPCKIMSSTMPRAWQTVLWDGLTEYDVDVMSNLNPLDKGDFAGMEMKDIKKKHSDWYEGLEFDPYNTRFPGGECYHDLVRRLESCVIDMEQAVSPVLVVSHVSVIQVLLAYFRGTPVEECTSIAVPMHTVITLTPAGGGGWMEKQDQLLCNSDTKKVEIKNLPVKDDLSRHVWPIWDDFVKT